MDLEDLVKLIGLIFTICVAIIAAVWKLFIHKHNSLYARKKREAYDHAFQNICIATIPRLSSFDWRAVELGLVAKEEFHDLKKKGIIDGFSVTSGSRAGIAICSIIEESDKHIPKYTYENRQDPEQRNESLKKCQSWMFDRLHKGEEFLNKNRMYIKKPHRDLFRDYLVLAIKFVDDQSEHTLDKVVAKRKEIERIIGVEIF